MACNRPLAAWYSKTPHHKTGRHGVTFTFNEADTSRPLELPCGRCIGCRLDKSKTWAMRMLHEARLYEDNWFVTLTYDEAALPRTMQGLPTLRPEHFTLFMKRLRKRFERDQLEEGGGAGALPSPPPARGIRYYQCGEYGERTQRPHHHAILFNLPIRDLRQVTTRARNAHTLYKSQEIQELWGHGHVVIGRVTFETAAYTAAYVTKKIIGPEAEEHYAGRVPEYATMSRRPGLGRGYLEKYWTEIWDTDEVIIRGHPVRPPRFYVTKLQTADPDKYAEIQCGRAAKKRTVKWREREAREVTQRQRLTSREPT